MGDDLPHLRQKSVPRLLAKLVVEADKAIKLFIEQVNNMDYFPKNGSDAR